MNLRKLFYPFEHTRANPQYPYITCMALHFQLWDRHVELEFADALLYGNLPERHEADGEVFLATYNPTCSCGQL